MTLSEARFVTVSGIAVPTLGAAALEEAMQNRLGLVDGEPGFGGLQVWRPTRSGDPYRMVTWWTDEAAFRDYMKSAAHHASHLRTPRGPDGPRPAGLDRYWCISDYAAGEQNGGRRCPTEAGRQVGTSDAIVHSEG